MNPLERITLSRAEEQSRAVRFERSEYWKEERGVWARCTEEGCDKKISVTHNKSGLCRTHFRRRTGQ